MRDLLVLPKLGMKLGDLPVKWPNANLSVYANFENVTRVHDGLTFQIDRLKSDVRAERQNRHSTKVVSQG